MRNSFPSLTSRRIEEKQPCLKPVVFQTIEVCVGRKFEEREHGRGEHNQIGAEYLPDGFKDVANMDDTRLKPNVLVFGLTNLAGDQSIAFPLDLLEGKEVMTYEFANESYLLQKMGEFTVVAFRLQGFSLLLKMRRINNPIRSSGVGIVSHFFCTFCCTL